MIFAFKTGRGVIIRSRLLYRRGERFLSGDFSVIKIARYGKNKS